MDRNITHRKVEGISISPARSETAVSIGNIHTVPGRSIEDAWFLYSYPEIEPRNITLYESNTNISIQIGSHILQSMNYSVTNE
jgi:hypothetical protein